MSDSHRLNLLGVYDQILSVGAIATGILMIQSNYGVFKEYPGEWLSKLPFHSWVWPGVLIIIVFGLGNMIASVTAFRRKACQTGIISMGMGGILLSCVVLQILYLGEWYLPDIYLLIVLIVQLLLSGSICFSDRINNNFLLKKGFRRIKE